MIVQDLTLSPQHWNLLVSKITPNYGSVPLELEGGIFETRGTCFPKSRPKKVFVWPLSSLGPSNIRRCGRPQPMTTQTRTTTRGLVPVAHAIFGHAFLDVAVVHIVVAHTVAQGRDSPTPLCCARTARVKPIRDFPSRVVAFELSMCMEGTTQYFHRLLVNCKRDGNTSYVTLHKAVSVPMQLFDVGVSRMLRVDYVRKQPIDHGLIDWRIFCRGKVRKRPKRASWPGVGTARSISLSRTLGGSRQPQMQLTSCGVTVDIKKHYKSLLNCPKVVIHEEFYIFFGSWRVKPLFRAALTVQNQNIVVIERRGGVSGAVNPYSAPASSGSPSVK
ncbi:hypothetical protein K438DRAFT_1780286 [Mycena galopus ATCC 62051]|nr:hypothetical protein K438DRAFT_1780286 [Mycena galopus ATCC 62051]